MKVCHPSENYTSLKSLILQLQLTLELSQFQEILSTYTNLLLLFVEYPYLFNFFKNEPIPLKGKNKLFKNNFITQDPARDGGNWYGYCRQNPLTFIDPNGLFSIEKTISIAKTIVDTVSLLGTSPALGAQHAESNTSLYQQQYTSLAEDRTISSKVLGIAGSLPLISDAESLLLTAMSVYMGDNTESSTLVTNPLSFIEGAEKEIARINVVIDSLKDNPENSEFINFMEKQRGLLSEEKDKNEKYSKDLGYNNITGGHVDPQITVTPMPGIDYIKAYEEHKENEVRIQKDE